MTTDNRPVTQARSRPATRIPYAARLVLSLLDRLQYGRLTLIAPDGSSRTFDGAGPGPHALLEVYDWAVFSRVMRAGDIGFAEAYREGLWDTKDLPGLLRFAAINGRALEQALRGGWAGRLIYRIRHLLRRNSRAGSRRNIQAHYDLGNDFYRLWLDSGMTYSSAWFESAEQDLEAAQRAKYERILRQLRILPGERVLEIGCGWGAFAEYAAETRGCRVTGITLSSEQLTWAQERIRRAGVSDLASVRLQDYRDVQGEFDAVVSIEMLEAVGEAYWPTFFDKVRNVLRPGGRAMVQTITIDDARFERYRRSTDFIQQYIFPGGMLPCMSRLFVEADAVGLVAEDTAAFGSDYAETLRQWLTRFDNSREAIGRLGFDQAFRRLWRFYLAYCEAGFREGWIDVHQIRLVRPS